MGSCHPKGNGPGCLVMGFPAPRPCKAGVGARWELVPSSHLCQNFLVPKGHTAVLWAINTMLSVVWSPDAGPECGSWSSPCASQGSHAPSKWVKSWRGGGPVATPIPQNGKLRLSEGLCQDSRSQRRPSPAPLSLCIAVIIVTAIIYHGDHFCNTLGKASYLILSQPGGKLLFCHHFTDRETEAGYC